MDTTLDGLLDRRVALEQPARGYRVAIDTVLLAAAVAAKAEDTVLDLGCGVGGAILCVAARVPGISVAGIEIQPELAELARGNVARNAFAAGAKILEGDVTKLPEECAGCFDHVLMNPPYHDEARHDVSTNAIRRAANTEKEGDLPLWISAAAKALRGNGTLTVIHRADRLEEILALAAAEGFGLVQVIPVVARLDQPGDSVQPRRIICRAQKGSAQQVITCQPLVLHKLAGQGGGYSEDADAVLRHMKPLNFIEN